MNSKWNNSIWIWYVFLNSKDESLGVIKFGGWQLWQSTGSFFHDKSITLGSLIGISSILELSRRSTRGRACEPARNKKNYKTKTWFLSLCSRLSTDAVSMNNAPSLGHFLEAERRAAGHYRNSASPTSYGVDDFSHVSDPNSLFVGGHVAPPQTSTAYHETTFGRDLLSHQNADGPPLLLSCLCGNLAHWSSFKPFLFFFGYGVWVFFSWIYGVGSEDLIE